MYRVKTNNNDNNEKRSGKKRLPWGSVCADRFSIPAGPGDEIPATEEPPRPY